MFVSRELVSLIRTEVQRRLAQPKLVRETSRRGLWHYLWTKLSAALTCAQRTPEDGFRDVVLPPDLDASLKVLAKSSRCGARAFYPNCCPYGLAVTTRRGSR